MARSEERSPALERWSAAMRSVASFQLLNLPALTLAETAELAQRVLDQPVPEAVAARLAEETGGNPLFLLETLFALLENTPAVGLAGALAQLPVGGSLHHLLRQRLARLSLPARQVAAAAAVLHSEFTPAVLAEVAQLDLETVTRAVDDLLFAHLVQPVPGRPMAAYSFIYGQIREVIRWEQGVARLRLLHLRAARVLAASENGSQRLAARLAHHYEQAGEVLQAFHCWRQASQYARGLFAIDEAQRAFEAAERLVPVLKELLSDETLYELYSTWGDTYIYDFTDSHYKQQLFQRMLRLGEERHSPMLIGGALSAQAYLISLQNHVALALETFQQAAYQLEPLADALPAVQNDYRQGWYLMRLTRYAEAARLFEKGLARLEGVTSPAADEQRADLEFRLGMLYLLTGWPVRAHQLAERALRRTQSPGQVYGHLVMANAKFYLGQNSAALEHVRLGTQLAAAFTSQRMTGLFYVTRSKINLGRGDLDAAWEQAQLAAELGAAHHIPVVVSMALTLQGEIYRRLGAPQAAIPIFQAGLAASRGPGDSLNNRLHLGMALADDGPVDEGLRQIETVCAEARQAGLGEVFLPALAAYTYLLAFHGRLAAALEVLQELAPLAQERYFLPAEVLSRMLMSLAAQQRGDEGEAHRLMDAALHTTAGMVNPFWELRCYHLSTRLGPLGKQEAGRVQELLELIDNHARDPELRPLVETFVQRNRAALLGLSQ
jgi:tetratricopeptide (TPR) repeat protein